MTGETTNSYELDATELAKKIYKLAEVLEDKAFLALGVPLSTDRLFAAGNYDFRFVTKHEGKVISISSARPALLASPCEMRRPLSIKQSDEMGGEISSIERYFGSDGSMYILTSSGNSLEPWEESPLAAQSLQEMIDSIETMQQTPHQIELFFKSHFVNPD